MTCSGTPASSRARPAGPTAEREVTPIRLRRLSCKPRRLLQTLRPGMPRRCPAEVPTPAPLPLSQSKKGKQRRAGLTSGQTGLRVRVGARGSRQQQATTKHAAHTGEVTLFGAGAQLISRCKRRLSPSAAEHAEKDSDRAKTTPSVTIGKASSPSKASVEEDPAEVRRPAVGRLSAAPCR